MGYYMRGGLPKRHLNLSHDKKIYKKKKID